MSRSVVAVTLRRSSVRRYRFHVTLALLMRRPCEKLSPSGLYGRVGRGRGSGQRRVRGPARKQGCLLILESCVVGLNACPLGHARPSRVCRTQADMCVCCGQLCARPLPRRSWPSTRSTWTRHPSGRSRRRCSSSTGRCSSPTRAAASPRSSAVVVPAHASRSRTGRFFRGENFHGARK